MPSRTSRLESRSKQGTLRVAIRGNLDLSLSFDLWNTCRLEQGCYRQYIFDLGRVADLTDSGLAWLLMFRRHALRSGAHVRITNCGIDVARRCEAAGLGVTSVRSQLQRSEPQPPAPAHLL